MYILKRYRDTLQQIFQVREPSIFAPFDFTNRAAKIHVNVSSIYALIFELQGPTSLKDGEDQIKGRDRYLRLTAYFSANRVIPLCKVSAWVQQAFINCEVMPVHSWTQSLEGRGGRRKIFKVREPSIIFSSFDFTKSADKIYFYSISIYEIIFEFQGPKSPKDAEDQVSAWVQQAFRNCEIMPVLIWTQSLEGKIF